MKKINFLVLIVAILALFSCNDKEWLTDNGIQSAGFYKINGINDAEQMINGCYWKMGGDAGWAGIHGNQQIYQTLMSDEGELEKISNPDVNEQNYFISRDFSNREFWLIAPGYWRDGYGTILMINNLLKALEDNPEKFQTPGNYWADRIKGEAYFLRAFLYYELVKIYGKPYDAPGSANNSSLAIVLYDKPAAGPDDYKSLSTVEEAYALIVSDIKKATKLLPQETNTTNSSPAYTVGKTRASKYAAYFLASRVYFQMHDYTKAEAYADSVLNSGKFPLPSDPLAAWHLKEYTDDASEVVWLYNNVNSQTQWKCPIQGRYFGFGNQGIGEKDVLSPGQYNNGQRLSVAPGVLQEIGWADTIVAKYDKRFTSLYKWFAPGKDPRTPFKAVSNVKVWPDKWYRVYSKGWPFGNNTAFPWFRSPEMYMTRAWCRLKKGDVAGATADYNVVASRAWNAAVAGTNYSPKTTVTESQINSMRLAEMLFEGDRIFYLQAIKMDIPARQLSSDSKFGNIHAGYSWKNFAGFQPPKQEADSNPFID